MPIVCDNPPLPSRPSEYPVMMAEHGGLIPEEGTAAETPDVRAPRLASRRRVRRRNRRIGDRGTREQVEADGSDSRAPGSRQTGEEILQSQSSATGAANATSASPTQRGRRSLHQRTRHARGRRGRSAAAQHSHADMASRGRHRVRARQSQIAVNSPAATSNTTEVRRKYRNVRPRRRQRSGAARQTEGHTIPRFVEKEDNDVTGTRTEEVDEFNSSISSSIPWWALVEDDNLTGRSDALSRQNIDHPSPAIVGSPTTRQARGRVRRGRGSLSSVIRWWSREECDPTGQSVGVPKLNADRSSTTAVLGPSGQPACCRRGRDVRGRWRRTDQTGHSATNQASAEFPSRQCDGNMSPVRCRDGGAVEAELQTNCAAKYSVPRVVACPPEDGYSVHSERTSHPWPVAWCHSRECNPLSECRDTSSAEINGPSIPKRHRLMSESDVKRDPGGFGDEDTNKAECGDGIDSPGVSSDSSSPPEGEEDQGTVTGPDALNRPVQAAASNEYGLVLGAIPEKYLVGHWNNNLRRVGLENENTSEKRPHQVLPELHIRRCADSGIERCVPASDDLSPSSLPLPPSPPDDDQDCLLGAYHARTAPPKVALAVHHSPEPLCWESSEGVLEMNTVSLVSLKPREGDEKACNCAGEQKENICLADYLENDFCEGRSDLPPSAPPSSAKSTIPLQDHGNDCEPDHTSNIPCNPPPMCAPQEPADGAVVYNSGPLLGELGEAISDRLERHKPRSFPTELSEGTLEQPGVVGLADVQLTKESLHHVEQQSANSHNDLNCFAPESQCEEIGSAPLTLSVKSVCTTFYNPCYCSRESSTDSNSLFGDLSSTSVGSVEEDELSYSRDCHVDAETLATLSKALEEICTDNEVRRDSIQSEFEIQVSSNNDLEHTRLASHQEHKHGPSRESGDVRCEASQGDEEEMLNSDDGEGLGSPRDLKQKTERKSRDGIQKETAIQSDAYIPATITRLPRTADVAVQTDHNINEPLCQGCMHFLNDDRSAGNTKAVVDNRCETQADHITDIVGANPAWQETVAMGKDDVIKSYDHGEVDTLAEAEVETVEDTIEPSSQEIGTCEVEELGETEENMECSEGDVDSEICARVDDSDVQPCTSTSSEASEDWEVSPVQHVSPLLPATPPYYETHDELGGASSLPRAPPPTPQAAVVDTILDHPERKRWSLVKGLTEETLRLLEQLTVSEHADLEDLSPGIREDGNLAQSTIVLSPPELETREMEGWGKAEDSTCYTDDTVDFEIDERADDDLEAMSSSDLLSPTTLSVMYDAFIEASVSDLNGGCCATDSWPPDDMPESNPASAAGRCASPLGDLGDSQLDDGPAFSSHLSPCMCSVDPPPCTASRQGTELAQHTETLASPQSVNLSVRIPSRCDDESLETASKLANSTGDVEQDADAPADRSGNLSVSPPSYSLGGELAGEVSKRRCTKSRGSASGHRDWDGVSGQDDKGNDESKPLHSDAQFPQLNDVDGNACTSPTRDSNCRQEFMANKATLAQVSDVGRAKDGDNTGNTSTVHVDERPPTIRRYGKVQGYSMDLSVTEIGAASRGDIDARKDQPRVDGTYAAIAALNISNAPLPTPKPVFSRGLRRSGYAKLKRQRSPTRRQPRRSRFRRDNTSDSSDAESDGKPQITQ